MRDIPVPQGWVHEVWGDHKTRRLHARPRVDEHGHEAPRRSNQPASGLNGCGEAAEALGTTAHTMRRLAGTGDPRRSCAASAAAGGGRGLTSSGSRGANHPDCREL